MAKQKPTFTITIVDNGRIESYDCKNEKAKNQWLYDYLSTEERMWSWVQVQNSNYKTFDKWFKEFIKPQWKESNFQSFRINKKLVLIRKK